VIADKIAEWLESKGITHAFGIIGGGNHVLWNAIVERGFTQIVSVHHEQAAVMAAAYYYRTCGKIAVAMVTTGGGSTNALTGVVAAYMDRVPVLILSGNEASKYMLRGLGCPRVRLQRTGCRAHEVQRQDVSPRTHAALGQRSGERISCAAGSVLDRHPQGRAECAIAAP
jgi:glyoxylate carboligase